jgi:hypothetical protein
MCILSDFAAVLVGLHRDVLNQLCHFKKKNNTTLVERLPPGEAY